MYADELLLPWLRGLVERLPGARLLDAHTHLGGNDPDGWRCTPAELTTALTLAGGRAVVFPLMERGGYRQANDTVLAAAAASDGRLVPFCRVDPHAGPVRELERCLAAGARGVKLHPRAERFELRHPGVAAVFAAAAERRLPVTIHSGLGIGSLGRDALMLGERYPGAPLILAHLGVTDLTWIWRRLGDHPSLFFDTAWWNPADHLALFALVPPGRILLASDAPYGTPATAAILAIRCALHAGLTAAQIEAVTGRQLERLLAGDHALDLGPAPGPPPPRPPLLDRVFALLVGALARMLEGLPATNLLQLARLGCQVDDGTPEAPLLQEVAELLDRQQRYAQTTPRDGRRAAGFHLVLTAAALAATPGAP
ncbi:MAG TPA: amidohydrolase family protein [Streptosporangiaceae bacterium]